MRMGGCLGWTGLMWGEGGVVVCVCHGWCRAQLTHTQHNPKHPSFITHILDCFFDSPRGCESVTCCRYLSLNALVDMCSSSFPVPPLVFNCWWQPASDDESAALLR